MTAVIRCSRAKSKRNRTQKRRAKSRSLYSRLYEVNGPAHTNDAGALGWYWHWAVKRLMARVRAGRLAGHFTWEVEKLRFVCYYGLGGSYWVTTLGKSILKAAAIIIDFRDELPRPSQTCSIDQTSKTYHIKHNSKSPKRPYHLRSNHQRPSHMMRYSSKLYPEAKTVLPQYRYLSLFRIRSSRLTNNPKGWWVALATTDLQLLIGQPHGGVLAASLT